MSDVMIERARGEARGLHERGAVGEAERRYRAILAAAPQDAETWHLLGVAAHQQGRNEEAVGALKRAVELAAGVVMYWRNLGKVLQVMGRKEEAVAALRRAVELVPGDGEVRYELGSALQDSGRTVEAKGCYEGVLRMVPGHVESGNNLGLILMREGRGEEARGLWEGIVRAVPGHMRAWGNLGILWRERGDYEKARVCFGHVVQLMPGEAEGYAQMAEACFKLGRGEEANGLYRRAVELRPEYAEAWAGLGGLLRELGELDEALACLERAAALMPGMAEAHANAAAVYLSQGRVEEAVGRFEKALGLAPESARIHSNYLYTIMLDGRLDAGAQLAAHREWDKRHAGKVAVMGAVAGRNKDVGRRLKVGYVSPEFYNHPVGRFLVPLLRGHDRRAVEVYCYSDVRLGDGVTGELKRHAGVWRESLRWTDAELAEAVRVDEIDILVDLSMHMRWSRLLAFARRPAPVQVTYLAYCGTTGMGAMDYRVTDPYLDPVEDGGAFYSEKSVWVPSYWCYSAPGEAGEVGELPAAGGGGVVFGCLNNFSKVSGEAVEVWGRVLLAVPGSRLLLHAEAGAGRGRVLEILGRMGVEAGRVEFVGQVSMREYFGMYGRVDVALDCFPYAGGTTSCDALWMGVPVVTLAGRTAVGRGGVSVLGNVGMAELVARTKEGYVEVAVGLAGDLGRLKGLRAGLRERMKGSRLMDEKGFVASMEGAYRGMWGEWCEGKCRIQNA